MKKYIKVVDYAEGLIYYYSREVFYSPANSVRWEEPFHRLACADFIIKIKTQELIKSRCTFEQLIDSYAEKGI
jgi:hypothetical protein